MERVKIGKKYHEQPAWKLFIGIPLIYLPLFFTIPFVTLGLFLIKKHLNFLGAQDIRSYWDFVPNWKSHRYHYNNQITYSTNTFWYQLRFWRFFWIFNCKLYCPLSVGLFRYLVYLVMIVENWWCPFAHDKKEAYKESAIDKSFWHLDEKERQMLHPEDLNNAQWNEDAEEKDRS